MAAASNLWTPLPSAAVSCGEVQVTRGPPSTRHPKLEPGSVAVKVKAGVALPVAKGGPEVMVVSGGVVSTEKAERPGTGRRCHRVAGLHGEGVVAVPEGRGGVRRRTWLRTSAVHGARAGRSRFVGHELEGRRAVGANRARVDGDRRVGGDVIGRHVTVVAHDVEPVLVAVDALTGHHDAPVGLPDDGVGGVRTPAHIGRDDATGPEHRIERPSCR